MTAPERIWAWPWEVNPNMGQWETVRAIVGDGTEYILHTRAALASSPLVQEIVAEAVNDQWVSTADSLPAKPGRNSYEHVRCLIFVNGEIEIGMWNCEHLCWDDDDGDDYRYDPETPTHWMPLPSPPVAIRARGE